MTRQEIVSVITKMRMTAKQKIAFLDQCLTGDASALVMLNAQKRRQMPMPKSCGCLQAGILINSETLEIMRCDECNLFDDDVDAAGAVEAMLKLFGKLYEKKADSTVADAMDHLAAAVETL